MGAGSVGVRLGSTGAADTALGPSDVIDFRIASSSSLNVPTGSDPRHTLLLVGVYYVLYTLDPNLLLNAGLTRAFTCVVPQGTVLNPVFPAAVGMRSLTCARLPRE